MTVELRRGPILQGVKKVASNDTLPKRRFGAKPAPVHITGQSNSETYFKNRSSNISNQTIQSVSEERQANLLARGTAQSASETPAPLLVYSNSYKKAQDIRKRYGLEKSAAATTVSGAGSGSFGISGSGDTIRQAPEVYSPLFQIANLQLPRDRITMNAWNRNFYDTHPLVHNCINLHSTYPISKINLKCKYKEKEQFFNDMIEEMDLVGILQNIALEFWKMGEVFPYAELDSDRGIWKNIVIQNPDYIHVKTSVLNGESVISMRPDAALQRLVTSNNPADAKLREDIDEEILYHIRKGNNIPLDNFHVSHLKMTSSPYDIHGTSVIVSIYKDLMLYDKLRESKFAQADNLVNPITLVTVGGTAEGEFHPTSQDLEQWRQTLECYDEETEVLTNNGFKKYNEVMVWEKNKDGKYNAVPKEEVEIACFNPDNEQLEYHKPLKASLYDYNGDMYHFNNTKVDICVTPNHDMWVSEKKYEYHGHRSKRKTYWAEWKKIKAKDLKLTDYKKLRSKIKWSGESVEFVDVLGKPIPIDIYLEFLGYILSEGCLFEPSNMISLSQTLVKYKDDMYNCLNKFASFFDINVIDKIIKHEHPKHDLWCGKIYNKDLFEYFKKEVESKEGKHKCYDKHIPRWILNLKPSLLKILLDAMVKGDGHIPQRKNEIEAAEYYTTSKDMADDVYEMVYKCGYVPTMFVRDDKEYMGNNRKELYTIAWSDTNIGEFPKIFKTFRNSVTRKKTNILNLEKYSGKVWCFTVPTGLFITRRNGNITIQGNSAQYDKDFKIISHAGIDIKRIGASGAIMDIGNDMNFIMDNILYGLMTPKAVITQEGASYNSASIGLEVLKQRYEAFRNMISRWLRIKIFAPISEIQEFYDYDGGEKKLIVPDIDWNQMLLFDMSDYIGMLQQLSQPGPQGEPPKVSRSTLFRSLGLDTEDEKRKIRKEMIDDMIAVKEKQILNGMSVSSLRALKPDEDIVEPTESPLPGVPGAEVPGALPGMAPGLGPSPFGGAGLGGGGFPGAGLGGGLAGPEMGGPGGEMGPGPEAGGEGVI